MLGQLVAGSQQSRLIACCMNDNAPLETLIKTGLETTAEVEALAQKAIERVGKIGGLLAKQNELIKKLICECAIIYGKLKVLNDLLSDHSLEGVSVSDEGTAVDADCLDLAIVKVKAMVDRA